MSNLPASFLARSPSRILTFERVLAGEFEVEVTITGIAMDGGERTELFRGSEMIVISQSGTREVRFP